MLCRAIATMLLVSGFYADAQLYDMKHVWVQCARTYSQCRRDFGYIDRDGRFHPATKKTVQ